MNISRLLKRLEQLESTTSSKVITFKMPDGSFNKLPSKDYLKVCTDAVYGVVSPQTDIVRNAVSCNESGNVLELFHNVIN